MEHDIRPWGEYFVLEDTPINKVKRIIVKPNCRLSYQYHNKRSEVWTIIKGTAVVTLDGVEKIYDEGQVVQIPTGIKHRIQNIGNEDLIFVEVQMGDYFGEDDIVRIDDDYNRV